MELLQIGPCVPVHDIDSPDSTGDVPFAVS